MKKKLFNFALLLLVAGTANARERFSTNDASAVYLLKSRHITVDPAGVKTVRIKRQLKILQAEGLDRFGDIQVPYNAHYESAKLIRAETLTPEGKRIAVQPDIVKDMLPQDARGYREYSDLRQLAFSMPALTKGAVIEYEVELNGKQPIIEGHFWTQHFIDDFLPIYTSRYTISTPEELDYTVLAPNITDTPEEYIRDGIRTRTWEQTEVPHLKVERQMPPGNEARQMILTSSIPDWEVVEAWFKGLMEDRVSQSDTIVSLARKLTREDMTRTEKINALSHFAQKSVRYVAIELGQGAYQPRPADSCLKNLYGDCKDKSVLLISLLKAVGIEAHIALVRPNYFGAIDQSLPHPGQFNHAIVFLPGEDQDRWLDPTIPGIGANAHPNQLDGCHALVMGREWRFHTIPTLPPEQTLLERTFEIFLSPDGMHRVISRETGYGRMAAAIRNAIGEMPDDEREEILTEQAKARAGFQRFIGYRVDNFDLLDDSFSYELEYISNAALAPHNGGFATKLEPFGVARALVLRDWESEKDGRLHPWVTHSTTAEALVVRVHLPPGFAPARDLQPYDKTFPHGTIQVSSSISDQVFEARVQAEIRRSVIKASRYDMTKRSVDRSMQAASRTIEFVNQIANLLARRQPGAARVMLEELVATHPNDAQLHHQLGLLFADLRYMHSAEKHIRRAIELEPDNLTFYEGLTRILLRYEASSDTRYHRDKVLKVFDEAEGKVTDTKRLQINRALAYATNAQNQLLGPGADKPKAIEITEGLLDDHPKDLAVLNLRATLAFRSGNYEDAIDYYMEAIEQGSTNRDMEQGLWQSEAFTGNLNAAINRLSQVILEPGRQVAELNYLMRMLALQKKYDLAEQLAGKMAELLRRPDLTSILLDEIEPLKREDIPDYRTFDTTDSPMNTVLTFVTAKEYGDEQRMRKALSPDVLLDCATIETYLRAERGNEDNRAIQNSQITIALQQKNVTENYITDGLAQLRIQPKANELRRSPQPIQFLLQKKGVQWQIIDLKTEIGNPPNFLVGVLHQTIQREDGESANHIIEYIANNYSAQASPARRRDYRLLLNEPCSTSDHQAKALAASALLNLGTTSASSDAQNYLESILPHEKENSTIHLLLSQVYAANGYSTRSARHMALAADLKTDLEGFAIEKVSSYLKSGDLALADTSLKELTANFPASRAIRPLMRELAQRQGKLDEALKLNEEIEADREVPDLTFHEVLLFLKTGNTEKFTTLTEGAEKNTPNGGLHRMLAYSAIAQGNFKQALNQLETARLLGSGGRDALMETARTLSLLGKHEDAKRMLYDFEQSMPCEEEYVISTAYVYHGRGQYDKAIDAYAKGLPLQSKLNRIYFGMLKAVCLAESGRQSQANTQYQAIMHNDHGSKAASYCADFAAMMLGEKTPEDVAKKINSIEDRLLRDDHLTEYHYYAGMRYLFDNEPGKAKDQFKQCIDLQVPLHMEYFLARMQLMRLTKK